MQPESFYEIEMKALLSPEQYRRLQDELPRKLKLLNEETIHTTRYVPGDTRLRHSDKTVELVCKEGDATKICRKETRLPLESKEDLELLAAAFHSMGYKTNPPWTKDKQEFAYPLNGFTYIVCLQDVKNFAYILEVEILCASDESAVHEPNLRAIIKELGCEPINPSEFSQRIEEYIKANKK